MCVIVYAGSLQYMYCIKHHMLSQFKDLFRIPFHVTPDPNEKVDRGKCVFPCCVKEFLLAFFHTNQVVGCCHRN